MRERKTVRVVLLHKNQRILFNEGGCVRSWRASSGSRLEDASRKARRCKHSVARDLGRDRFTERGDWSTHVRRLAPSAAYHCIGIRNRGTAHLNCRSSAIPSSAIPRSYSGASLWLSTSSAARLSAGVSPNVNCNFLRRGLTETLGTAALWSRPTLSCERLTSRIFLVAS